MSNEEIKKSMEKLQSDYNRLCGLHGHMRAQVISLEEGINENIADIKQVLKKVRSLEANMPKEEPKLKIVEEETNHGETTADTGS